MLRGWEEAQKGVFDFRGGSLFFFTFLLPLERILWTTIRWHLRPGSSPTTRKPRRRTRRRTGTEQHVTATGQRCGRPYLRATRPLPTTDVWLNVCDAHNNNIIWHGYRLAAAATAAVHITSAAPVRYLLPPPRHYTQPVYTYLLLYYYYEHFTSFTEFDNIAIKYNIVYDARGVTEWPDDVFCSDRYC